MHSLIPSGIRLVICALLAVVLHIFAYTLGYLAWPTPTPTQRTLPTVLLMASTQSHAAKNASAAAPNTNNQETNNAEQALVKPKELLSTNSESRQKAQTKQTKASSSKAQESAEKSQNSRQSRAQKGLKSLFANTSQSDANSQIKQISTRKTPPLSDYQKALIQHMVRADLYDRFHDFLANRAETKAAYQIEFRLMENGAIQSARITKSTGISALDELAVTTAYNASPYPPPPRSDSARGYRYTIPVEYLKQQDQ